MHIVLFKCPNCGEPMVDDMGHECPDGPVPLRDHWKRLGYALLGKWRIAYQLGRKSKHKGYFLEITHAAKNIVVESLRARGIWNRPQRPENRCLGYNFPK